MKPCFRIILILSLLLPSWAALAGVTDPPRDSLSVHFRVGQSQLDLNYLDNQKQIDAFVARVLDHYDDMPARSLELVVYGGASPEGPTELNRRLGEQRGLALREVLVEKLGDLLGEITVVNQGALCQFDTPRFHL